MSLEAITNEIKAKVGEGSDLGATLKFNLGDEGVIYVDGADVSNDDNDAECTINIAVEDIQALMSGDLDPMTAFMTGKLKVDGNMAIAMKLQSVLG